MSYTVSTPVFEGPFDLLLHLITREEVDIYAVTLSGIVDAYLAELDRIKEEAATLDLEVATEFLLIAATLIELKARRLLPGRADLDLDDELLFEERDLLLARLLECKTFKDAAAALDALRQEAAKSVPRLAGPEEPFASMAPDPLERIGLGRFLAAALAAFTPRPDERVPVDHIAPIRASVRDAVEEVLAAIPQEGSITFRALTAGLREPLDIVVRFLAVLELYKRGAVDIEQTEALGDLTIRLEDPEGFVDLNGFEEWDAGLHEIVLEDEPVHEQ